jgi:hypothetical protein
MNPLVYCPCGALKVLNTRALNEIQNLLVQNYLTENA